ncbi:MAG: alpha/beta hydrolase [Actinomycetota bacterium]|nr:alpha/beta hydrolase [Actinomycetota bacterium]
MIPVAQKRRLRTSGGELAYVESGDPSAAALLLLHGFPLSSIQWRDLIPLFASRFHVIAPDLLGSGGSDKPVGSAVDIPAQAAYVSELLAGVGIDRFAVVGHGTGGGVAQLLALDGDGVEALVLLDAAGSSAWPGEVVRALRESLLDTEPGRSAVGTAFDLGMRQGRRPSHEILGEYARSLADDGGVEAFGRVLASLERPLLAARERDLPRIEAPALILWGEEDPFQPLEVAERLSEAMPSSALGVVPGCGHYLVEEAGETIGPMIHEYLRARYLHAPHGHDDTSGVVMLQLERRPPWVDLEEDEHDDWFDVDDDEGSEA